MKCKYCKSDVIVSIINGNKLILEPVTFKVFKLDINTKKSSEIVGPLYKDHKTLCKGMNLNENQIDLWSETYTVSKIVDVFDGKI